MNQSLFVVMKWMKHYMNFDKIDQKYLGQKLSKKLVFQHLSLFVATKWIKNKMNFDKIDQKWDNNCQINLFFNLCHDIFKKKDEQAFTSTRNIFRTWNIPCKFIINLAPLCDLAPPEQSVTRKGNYFGAQRGQTGDGMVWYPGQKVTDPPSKVPTSQPSQSHTADPLDRRHW